MKKYNFPFDIVPRGTKIAIYGAGEVGEQYIQQLLCAGLYKLVCVIDKNAKYLCSDDVKLARPKELNNIIFDYLVIAIKQEALASIIKQELIEKYALDEKKIIWVNPISSLNSYLPIIKGVLPIGASVSSTKITMGVFLGGGFGDAICSKKTIVALAEESGFVCEIDLYVEKTTHEFVKNLYSDCPYVKNVFVNIEYNFKKIYMQYDIAYKPAYIFELSYYDIDILKRKNKEFADKIISVDEFLKKDGMRGKRGIANYVQFKRCELRGENIYTVNSFGGILPITDCKVNVPLLPSGCVAYHKLHIDRPFITLNYGWGNNPRDKSIVPSKIWPISYFQELAKMIKTKHPELCLVQIARGQAPEIQAADICYRDLDIEVVKYILKNSMLHIDSEGGMVHLATQLDTKCMVFFGPTSVRFFGYTNNINIVSLRCSNCYYMDEDFTKCIKGLDQPECMYSITPMMAFEKFEKYISEIG